MPSQVGWKPKHNPWIIALVVTMATFMEVLDTSIANVALPHIAGNLSTGLDESTWVLSSYMVANAVVLPVGAWLATWFGRKRFYMSCVVMFGVSSFLCGLAPNLGMLVFFRVLQGLGGGGLAPTEQSILADVFPPEKRGMAFAVYGMAVVLAPAIGPTLGGWVTDHYNWRWIFFINVPVAVLSLLLTSRLVEDPPYLKELRAKLFKVDYVGFGLLAIGIGALQVVFDKGERENWFDSGFIQIFTFVSIICLVSAGIWEYFHEHPVIDVRLFKHRNLTVSCVMMFMLGASLFGATVLLPQLLQTLMGYSAQDAGMVLSPGAIIIILMLPFVGKLVSKVDARILISLGFGMASVALFHMTGMSLEIDFKTAVMLRVYQMVGVAFLFVPIQTVCYMGIPRDKTNAVSGLTNLARNIGGSVGIAAVTTILSRRSQFHQTALVSHVTASDPALRDNVASMTKFFAGSGVDVSQAAHMAYGRIYGMVQVQAAVLGYLDAIWVFGILCALMVPLAFVMKRPARSNAAPAGH